MVGISLPESVLEHTRATMFTILGDGVVFRWLVGLVVEVAVCCGVLEAVDHCRVLGMFVGMVVVCLVGFVVGIVVGWSWEW